jgi:hypothetical protein
MSNSLNLRSAFLYVLFTLAAFHFSYAGVCDTLKETYDSAFQQVISLIQSNGSFKKAVFITEDTYGKELISENEFLAFIDVWTSLARKKHQYYDKQHAELVDNDSYLLNRSIFSTICDTIKLRVDTLTLALPPFQYDFNDPIGKKDWTNMFVTKLLTTHKGNCHSLSYLYKILADELGAKCWLALAPNHIYIRNYSQKIGWYNTELTSGLFPTDAWIATTGYVSTDAIRSGIYMDTLSNQQSIALCVLDLAKGYEFQTHNYYDGFILKCCDLVLQYHPVNPMALLLKAETLKKLYFKQVEDGNSDSTGTYADMERTYITLARLNYREMPEKMYQQWLASLAKQKDKFTNKKIVPSKKTLKNFK